MNAKCFRFAKGLTIFSVIAVAGIAATTVAPASAQLRGNSGAAGGRGGQVRRPAPRNFLPELKEISVDVAKRGNIRLVVDPAIFLAAKPVAPDANLNIEQTMDALVATGRDLAWRRAYLAVSAADTIPAADKLAESARSLDKLEQSGLVLENPLTKKATSFLKNWAVTTSFAADLTANQFSANPVYILYTTKPAFDGKAAADRLAALQRESMDLMSQLDENQMAEAMSQGLNMMMNMDPDTRSRLMGMQMRAGMQMFQNMSPDQRNELMQQSMKIFQQGPPGQKP